MDAREKWREVRALDTPISLPLGPNTVDRYIHDPKRIGFMLARYKFASKMLQDCRTILEVGCGDGFGTLLLAQSDADVIGTDFDESLIDYANTQLMPAVEAAQSPAKLHFFCADFLETRELHNSAGVVCLDVIEHISPDDASDFIYRLREAAHIGGIVIVGTPNALAAQYASEHSQTGHINLYTPDRLREELKHAFSHVFLFSMNDEIVHTGFDKLAHYLMAVCIK